MIEEKTIGKFTYLDADCIASGDYGGAGTVGIANQRYIDAKIKAGELTSERFNAQDTIELERDGFITVYAGNTKLMASDPGFMAWEPQPFDGADVLIFEGGYSSRYMWVRADIDFAEEVNGLADYPCFDDEIISEVESEWEVEAWTCYVRDDLTRGLDDTLSDKADGLEERSELFTIYRQAMEDTNTYPTPEYTGSHIDTDAIQETFTDLLKAA